MSVALDPGTTFAGYRIESVIGRGGMGVVYRATDLSLERPVALKLIAPELAERRALPPPLPARAAARRLARPPERVPIYEAGEHDGQLYLAMRYVEGSDLKTLLRASGRSGARARARRPRPGRRARSTPRTGAASCTATSSRPTSCSTRTATPT